jgi:hypothetical protein
MIASNKIFFAEAISNLDSNNAVEGWGENVFASLSIASGKKLSFTETELLAEIDRLEEAYNAKQYQRDRLQEYPSIQELVVALYDESDKASIIERRKAVKAKYPKPK